MKTTYIPLLIIAAILAAATWTARITTQPASAMATSPGMPASSASSVTRVINPVADENSNRSPMEIARAIHAARTARGDGDIGEYVVESGRQELVRFLSAVDDVIAADVSLHERVKKTLGVSLPRDWNMRVIEDNLGLFSTNVSFISESIKGDEAEVTIQEGCHVPLVHARFVRMDGRWLHEPEAIPAGVVPALSQLAAVIRDVEKSVEEGAPFESLADAFTFRIMPRIQDVARAGENASAE